MVRKFGIRDNSLSNIKFALFHNYLIANGITILNTSKTQRKVGNNKKESVIHWVEFAIQPTDLSRSYKILIVNISGYTPHAFVLSPSLHDLKQNDNNIPHLYDQKRYKLCLHYPHTNDFNENIEIGQQYIPWIKLWLFYFEIWLIDGVWKGGGVEPNDEFDKKHNPKHNSSSKIDDMEKGIKNKSSIEIASEIYDKRLKKHLEGQQNG